MAKKKKKLPESEEDFHLKCDVSPFKIHFKQIYDEKLTKTLTTIKRRR